MIIDAHAYCFEPIDQPAGHANGAEHLRWVQAAHAAHHQPAWRVRDRAPARSDVLAPQGRTDLSRLPDVNFRADPARGRVVWTVDGQDYTKQFFPPNLRDVAFTPHSLVAEMDYAGVDVALLHTDPMLGRDSAYQAWCVQQYPDRLRSMAPVDEWRLGHETDAVIAELERAIQQHGLHAIKFIPPFAYLNGPQPWDDGVYRPFWQAATALGVPVFFTLGAGPGELACKLSPAEQRQGYLDELGIMTRWMTRYPDVPCGLTHGFPWRLFLKGERIVLPEAIWAPFENPNCHLEVSFPVRLGDRFDYPYREVWPTLAEMIARVGAARLFWGTDMPFQNRFCTYRQSRDWLERYTWLDKRELAQLMSGTAARLLGIDTTNTNERTSGQNTDIRRCT
jgi:predicted TIM-barrel fold metal-dependent hydrolase